VLFLKIKNRINFIKQLASVNGEGVDKYGADVLHLVPVRIEI